MKYSEIKLFDIANGTGVRTSIFVSGCRRHCKGCFNSKAWSFYSGQTFDQDTIKYILDSLSNSYIDGLSILGGEPLEPENCSEVLNLIEQVRNLYSDKSIWLWTGFRFEDLVNEYNEKNPDTIEVAKLRHSILKHIDILVDGEFIEDKKEVGLRFRGSSNQRILDSKKSIANESPILWNDDPLFDNHLWPGYDKDGYPLKGTERN